ncbi:MAG: hypothetical protein OXI56_05865 [bacterium]|nr:hypothetical protein [bacterium]
MGVPVLVVAALLLLSGLPKIADPRPVAGTMEWLYDQVSARWRGSGGSPVDLSRPGRLLGLAEVGVAGWVVLGPSWGAAVALTLLAAGFAAAGLVGALSDVQVACACFGRQGRPLGYFHVLLFPVWVGAAWCVGRVEGFGGLDERLLALGLCCVGVLCVYLVRMWAALMPLAQHRRRAAMRVGTVTRVAHGEAEWLLPR